MPKNKVNADTGHTNEELLEVLKFTPRTYKIQIWGYGGEYVMGTVDRKIYDYFRSRRLSVSDFAWDYNYAEENNIPEDMWPFVPGSWYECEDMGHVYGVDRNSGTLQIYDENDELVYQRQLEDIDGTDIQLQCNDEIWVDSQAPGTVVFFGYSSDKGTFFEGELELGAPFDPEELMLKYDEIDANEIVTGVEYQGIDIDNNGGDTTGKGSEHAFYIAGSNTGSGYTRYCDMDDIKYQLTDWFSAKTNPVREGKYEVETQDGYNYHGIWTGKHWKNDWNDEKIKVKQWRGIAYDPDEQDLRDELDNIMLASEN